MRTAGESDGLLAEEEHDQREKDAGGMKTPCEQHPTDDRAVVEEAQGRQRQVADQPERTRTATPSNRIPPGTVRDFTVAALHIRKIFAPAGELPVISAATGSRNWPPRFDDDGRFVGAEIPF